MLQPAPPLKYQVWHHIVLNTPLDWLVWVSPTDFLWKLTLCRVNFPCPEPRTLSTPYSITWCPGSTLPNLLPSLFLSLRIGVYTHIHTQTYHSLSLWAIPLKHLLSSFNSWLWAPPVLTVFQGRRDHVWCWMVAHYIRSVQLVYLAQAMPMVCRFKTSISRRWLGVSCWCQVPFHHRCTLLGFIKVHPLLIWMILNVIPLIQCIATIVVMTYSGRVI